MSAKDSATDTLRYLIEEFLAHGAADEILRSGDLTRAEVLQLFGEALDQRLRSIS